MERLEKILTYREYFEVAWTKTKFLSANSTIDS